MKLGGKASPANIKFFLFIIALVIGIGTFLYTNSLITILKNKNQERKDYSEQVAEHLQEKERQIVQLFAKGLEYIANSTTESSDLTFLFDNIIKPIDFPLILTDSDGNINLKNKSDIRNLTYDSTLSDEKLEAYLKERVEEMDKQNEPIKVTYVMGTDTITLTEIHYGESELVRQLRTYPYDDSELIEQLQYYPYVQIAIAAIFILIGYLGFSQIKKTEQSNIWVGMAKETAHQFGTPISSLMGWTELLKLNYNDSDKVLDAAEEIENDIEKLHKITNRFSKIGSKADLVETNLFEAMKPVLEYFQRRLPQHNKKVELMIEGDKEASALLNTDLFDWVIENLIKNALDAIEHNHGIIRISVKNEKKSVEIEVADNGKGIDMKKRKDIFRPGFSTKRRGWGLGLSLSKRIIENYHRGKIFVKNSIVNEGTVFKIILQKR